MFIKDQDGFLISLYDSITAAQRFAAHDDADEAKVDAVFEKWASDLQGTIYDGHDSILSGKDIKRARCVFRQYYLKALLQKRLALIEE